MPRETYQLLVNQLMDVVLKRERDRWEHPDFEVIEKPLSDVMDEYVQEYMASMPDRSNLKKVLADLQKKQRRVTPNFAAKRINASEEELQQRVRHADACLKAMGDAILAEVEHMTCFYDTVDRLFGKDGSARKLFGKNWRLSGVEPGTEDRVTSHISSFRNMQYLMNTSPGPEAKAHNERVIMLMALNERRISEEDYRSMREAQLSARYPENYQKMVQQELDHRFDELFDVIRKDVESRRALRNSPEMEKYRACIADVHETDPDKLEEAYGMLYTAGCCNVAFAGSSIANKMQEVYKDENGVSRITEDQQKMMKAWEDDECEYQKTLQSTSLMANPYSALVDLPELVDLGIWIPEAAANVIGDARHGLKDLGVSTVYESSERQSESYQASKETQTQEHLLHAGMQGAVRRDTQHPEMHVYEKDGQKLILKNETDLDGHPHVRADIPGKLINYDFTTRLSELDERCRERDQSWGSKAYTEMRRALHAMQGTMLSDNPSAAELEALQQKLENVQQKVDAYMERKRRQRVAKGDAEVIGGKPYEQERIRFARELGAFTQDKLAAIESIRVHQATMQRGLDAAVNGPQEAMREPAGGDLHRVRTSIHEIVHEKNAEAVEKKQQEKKSSKKPEKKAAAKSDKKPSKKPEKKADKKAAQKAHYG